MECNQQRKRRSKQAVSDHLESNADAKGSSVKSKEKVPQILDVLREIQGQCKSTLSLKNSRKCAKLMRSMVINESYTFSVVADMTTAPPIHYDQNTVYVGNFNMAFRVGCYSVAQWPYFQPAPFRHNVAEYLYVQAPIDKNCDECSKLQCCQPSILALSTKNDLKKLIVIHFGASSGYVRHFVLDANSSFGSAKMHWNVAYESFYVSLNLNSEGLFKCFMFSVFPIRYKGCLTIKKYLGGRIPAVILDVMLSLDMLIFHQGRDVVRLYNIHGSMLALDFQSVEINSFDELTDPLLVVNKCAQFSMQVGGFPFRLLTGRVDGGHDIRTLNGERIGLLKPLDINSITDDTVMFSETESGQIIQRGEHSISVFKPPEEICAPEQLTPLQTVYFNFHTPVDRPTQSSFGRTLTRRNYVEDNCSKHATIMCDLDLEDELDLIYTITCDYTAVCPQLYINILDSETLLLLKAAPLRFPFPINRNGDYETLFQLDVSADRDLLIIRWRLGGKYHLIIYQLHHRNAKSISFITSQPTTHSGYMR